MNPRPLIDVASAEALVDLGAGLGSNAPRARPQLEGAVAVHNMLQKHRVAYLADEVGLGKTYVALTALAIFRHFNPDFKALIIAPRQNIQLKWMKDWRTFVRTNWLIEDLRVKAFGGAPARPIVKIDRLDDIAVEAQVDDDRDFFMRLTSFSLSRSLAGHDDVEREEVVKLLPWLRKRDLPATTDRTRLRSLLGQAVNVVLPHFDLVIIDEAHNLKHGVRIEDGRISHAASNRNGVLANVLGHQEISPERALAAHFAPIADRVLLLSATPVENDWRHLYNQLYLVDRLDSPSGPAFTGLVDKKISDTEKKELAAAILIRRVNYLSVNGERLTKNLYRSDWHHGGLSAFDEPLPAGSVRERLTVALVQKKVAEVISSERFNDRFQMGMLASFESFSQTAAGKVVVTRDDEDEDEEDAGNFYDSNQADRSDERTGIDTAVVNRLADSHYREFDAELSHPKMDALVASVSAAWTTGAKTLVFVRRVASVDEIKRKLDETYNSWLLGRLQSELPEARWAELRPVVDDFHRERETGRRSGADKGDRDDAIADTFFGWFFRGESTLPIVSGATLSRRLRVSSFFGQPLANYLLECDATTVWRALADATGLEDAELRTRLGVLTQSYLPKQVTAAVAYDAVQRAAVDLLAEHRNELARDLMHQFAERPQSPSKRQIDVKVELERGTFFTTLAARTELAARIWPQRALATPADLKDRYLRAELLASAIRLGNPLIDLYIDFAHEIANLRGNARSDRVEGVAAERFLRRLEQGETEGWGSHRELGAIANDFDLIVRLNVPELLEKDARLDSAATALGDLLGRQQPAAGVVGGGVKTAVKQFRMPGYPLVMICTDVLCEGEDLHTYCDRVVHYGVAWTPSVMEQRNGRVDRVSSLADRRLAALERSVEETDKIQVQIPYLKDSVEYLQVHRVLRRLHQFTELMHEFGGAGKDDPRVEVDAAEFRRAGAGIPRITEPLRSAFDVRPADLAGAARKPLVLADFSSDWRTRLAALRQATELPYLAEDTVHWDNATASLYATRSMGGGRQQPFALRLDARGGHVLLHCYTPIAALADIGRNDVESVIAASGTWFRVTAVEIVAKGIAARRYNLALEGDVLLGAPEFDSARARSLVEQLTAMADELERRLTRGDLTLTEVKQTLDKDHRHDR